MATRAHYAEVMGVLHKPYSSFLAVVLAAGLATPAAGQPILEDSGLHTVSGGDAVEYVGLSGKAELVMTGGEVFSSVDRSGLGGSSQTGVWLEDDSGATVTGGEIVHDVHLSGGAELQFLGGASGAVHAGDDAQVNVSAGTLESMRLDGAAMLNMIGGEVGESMFLSGDAQAYLSARSFAYDHDGDPGTPAEPLDFGGASEVVITESDPRLDPTGSQNELALRGLTAVWEDGTTATFDLVGTDGFGWSATLRRGRPADLNGDGFVNTLDLVLMLNEWGVSCDPCAADLNSDGFVNVADLSLLLTAWGS